MLRSTNYTKKLSGTVRHLLHTSTVLKSRDLPKGSMLRSTNYTKKLSGTIRHLPHQDLHPSTCWKAGNWLAERLNAEKHQLLRNCQAPFDIFHIKIFTPPHCWKAGRKCRKAQCWKALKIGAVKHQSHRATGREFHLASPCQFFFTKRLAPMSVPPK